MAPTHHGNWSRVGTWLLLKTLLESCGTRGSWRGTELAPFCLWLPPSPHRKRLVSVRDPLFPFCCWSKSRDEFPFSFCVGKMFFMSFVQNPGIPGKGGPGQTSVGCSTDPHAESLSIWGAPLLRFPVGALHIIGAQ